MKSLFCILVLVSTLFLSFSGSNEPMGNKLTVQNHNISNADILGPLIKFENTGFDFDTLYRGDKAITIFRFKNIGTQPLSIIGVYSDCATSYSRKHIMPGHFGIIEVKYDSKRLGQFNKSIRVVSNSIKDSRLLLKVKGIVLLKPQPISFYNISGISSKAYKCSTKVSNDTIWFDFGEIKTGEVYWGVIGFKNMGNEKYPINFHKLLNNDFTNVNFYCFSDRNDNHEQVSSSVTHSDSVGISTWDFSDLSRTQKSFYNEGFIRVCIQNLNGSVNSFQYSNILPCTSDKDIIIVVKAALLENESVEMIDIKYRYVDYEKYYYKECELTKVERQRSYSDYLEIEYYQNGFLSKAESYNEAGVLLKSSRIK